MRTTITLDDQLANQLMQITGEHNPVAAIRLALQDYLRLARKQQVLALRGQVQVDDNWQALRALDSQDPT